MRRIALPSTPQQQKLLRSRSSVATRATALVAPTEKLNSGGVQFAPIINGCWQLAGGHGKEVFQNLEEKLAAHAEAGLTTFDTADIYGPSEKMVGQFGASWAAQGRPPIQIFTKYVPNIFQQRQTPAAVEAGIRRSLAALQVPALDCVQLHWWDYKVPGMVDTGKALADLQGKGLIKAVGLTNMDVNAVSQIVEAGVTVACNQVQFSMLDRRPLNGMLQYCEPRGIKLFAYGSLGGGLLSDKYVQAPKPGLPFVGGQRYSNVDLNTSSLKMYFNTLRMAGGGGQKAWRQLLQVLRAVADKHGVSVANVALRWVMQQGSGKMVHPIVGLRSAAHVADNVRALSFQLDAQDLQRIAAELESVGTPGGDIYSFERQ